MRWLPNAAVSPTDPACSNFQNLQIGPVPIGKVIMQKTRTSDNLPSLAQPKTGPGHKFCKTHGVAFLPLVRATSPQRALLSRWPEPRISKSQTTSPTPPIPPRRLPSQYLYFCRKFPPISSLPPISRSPFYSPPSAPEPVLIGPRTNQKKNLIPGRIFFP